MAASIMAKPTGLLGSSILLGAGGDAAVQLIDLPDMVPAGMLTLTGVRGGRKRVSLLATAVPRSGDQCQSVLDDPSGRPVQATASTITQSRGSVFQQTHKRPITEVNAERLRRDAAKLAAIVHAQAQTRRKKRWGTNGARGKNSSVCFLMSTFNRGYEGA
jgi:hypothetical protein